MSFLSKFHYEVFGTNIKGRIVFLHGLMGYGSNWKTVAREFAGEFEVLLFDQRGHGRSFSPQQGYAPDDYAQDLSNILDELNWPEIYLVGHSMGGRNAFYFAAKFPHRVKKLVIEDIGPEGMSDGGDYIKNIFNITPTPFASKKAAKNFFLEDFPILYKGEEDPRVLGLFLYSNIVELEKGGTADWRFSREAILESVNAGRATDHWDEIKGLEMPTLIIRGERSKELSQVVYQKMLRLNQNLRGVVVPEAGHWVHSEKPQEIISIIKEFIG